MPAAESNGAEHGEAYRCSICSLNFPRVKAYATCPACGEVCTGYSNVAAMPEHEARSIALHAKFERFYVEDHTADLELTADENILVDLAVLNERTERMRRLSRTARAST